MTIEALYQIYLKYPRISTDTRKIQPGDIYVALKGEHFNGNQFAHQALALGAAYCIVDESHGEPHPHIIRVADSLGTLQSLAGYHRQQLSIPVIGITGSNGKTTTKELMAAVLRAQYRTTATEGNLNNHIGVPLTLLSITPDTEIAIVEMGANHAGEIAGYCRYARPDFALINNCGKAHLEGFGSIEGVRRAKGELYDFIREHDGTIFINNDLDYLQDMARGITRRFSYGQSNADIIGRDVSDTPLLKVAVLNHMLESEIRTRLTGSYNLPNVLAAIAVGTYFQVPIETIKEALEAYVPGNSRSQWIKTGRNELILDAYNANPSSMEAAIRNFAAIPAASKILLLGSMKEVGNYSTTEHQKVVDLCRELGLKQVFLVGSEFATADMKGYPWFADSLSLKTYIQSQQWRQQLILIKGSRGSRMEVVTEAL